MVSIASLLLVSALPGQTAGDDTPAHAAAQPPAVVRPTFVPSKEEARRLFAKGQALYGKRKYRKAIQSLTLAVKHWNRREIHFNIALCHYELRQRVPAVTHLRIYLKGATAAERKNVPRPLRRMRRKVGVVVISSTDPRAEIFVNNVSRGRGRTEVVVAPGPVQVTIRRPGLPRLQRTMRARPGGTTHWDVTVNRIRVVGPPARSRRRLHWQWFTATASVAVAAAVTAVVLGVRTKALHDRFDRNPTWDTRQLGVRTQIFTNAMWVLAGSAAIAAGVLAYFTRWRRTERQKVRRIVPVLTPLGAAVSGHF